MAGGGSGKADAHPFRSLLVTLAIWCFAGAVIAILTRSTRDANHESETHLVKTIQTVIKNTDIELISLIEKILHILTWVLAFFPVLIGLVVGIIWQFMDKKHLSVKKNCVFGSFFASCLLLAATGVAVLVIASLAQERWNAINLEKGSDIKHDYEDNDTAIVNAWNEIQHVFKCCGVSNYKDFRDFRIPIACCNATDEPEKNRTETCENFAHNGMVYQEGCHDYIITFVHDKVFQAFRISGLVTIGAALISILLLLLALVLIGRSSCMKKRRDIEDAETTNVGNALVIENAAIQEEDCNTKL